MVILLLGSKKPDKSSKTKLPQGFNSCEVVFYVTILVLIVITKPMNKKLFFSLLGIFSIVSVSLVGAQNQSNSNAINNVSGSLPSLYVSNISKDAFQGEIKSLIDDNLVSGLEKADKDGVIKNILKKVLE